MTQDMRLPVFRIRKSLVAVKDSEEAWICDFIAPMPPVEGFLLVVLVMVFLAMVLAIFMTVVVVDRSIY